MANQDEIYVPRMVLAKPFYALTKEQALRDCLARTKAFPQGCEPQFMPEVIDTRIAAPKGSKSWNIWFTAPSIRATGKTKQGLPVVVYAHVPNYFSNPDNHTKAVQQGLVDGAGRMPQEELQRLLDFEDGKRVFVVDYSALRSSKSGVINIQDALKHPQTIPFLGGKRRAESYLLKHEENYGTRIGNWHSDDLSDGPLVRLLNVGNVEDVGLSGDDSFNNSGQFLGLPKNSN